VKTLTGILLLAGCALGVAASDGKLRVLEQDRPVAHHLLYLPNGRYLKLATLGNAPLAADLIYLWSIQFYGDYQAEDRYQYVQHIYGNVITELDPHYFDPYWIGALILSVETHDLDKALALLDKGFANNPDRWIYPYLAGWECSYARQYDRAAAYFRKAAAVPSSPPDVERLVAGMYQKQGASQTALAEWARLARETNDANVRRIAENRARALKTEIDVAILKEAVARYRDSHGAWPRRLTQLTTEGILPSVPTAVDGSEYHYDPATGVVSAGPDRVIVN
jgi:tetratricopeptide (TPR) repeat protein